MRYAVFGATGKTGIEFVKYVLSQKHDILALVRNEEKFKKQLESVDIPENASVTSASVDIFDCKSLEPHLIGVDAVISCLGSYNIWYSTAIYSSLVEIVKAMQSTNIKRIVVCSTWCSEYRSGNPVFIEWLFKPLFIGSVCRDHRRAERHLEGITDGSVNFTIVRPPGLKDIEAEDCPIETAYGSMWVPNCASGISRAKVARYMFQCIHDEATFNKDIAIGLKKLDQN